MYTNRIELLIDLLEEAHYNHVRFDYTCYKKLLDHGVVACATGAVILNSYIKNDFNIHCRDNDGELILDYSDIAEWLQIDESDAREIFLNADEFYRDVIKEQIGALHVARILVYYRYNEELPSAASLYTHWDMDEEE